jgi:hypothetical protein
MERFSRREMIIALAGLVLPGCQNPEKLSAPEILSFYPELKNLPVKEKGQIKTPVSTTDWYNFSQTHFQKEPAYQIINYFEELAKQQSPLKLLDLQFRVEPRPKNKKIIIFVPDKTPQPYWSTSQDGATTARFNGSPIISFVRVVEDKDGLVRGSFSRTESYFQRVFSTEVCQASLDVIGMIPRMNQVGQEVFCNSLGISMALKYLELSYQTYTDWTQQLEIETNPPLFGYPFYVLSETEYLKLPMTESVIKK